MPRSPPDAAPRHHARITRLLGPAPLRHTTRLPPAPPPTTPDRRTRHPRRHLRPTTGKPPCLWYPCQAVRTLQRAESAFALSATCLAPLHVMAAVLMRGASCYSARWLVAVWRFHRDSAPQRQRALSASEPPGLSPKPRHVVCHWILNLLTQAELDRWRAAASLGGGWRAIVCFGELVSLRRRFSSWSHRRVARESANSSLRGVLWRSLGVRSGFFSRAVHLCASAGREYSAALRM